MKKKLRKIRTEGNWSRIIKRGDDYDVYLQIQDGHQFLGTRHSEEEARRCWVVGMKVWNGFKRVNKMDVPIYEVRSIREEKLIRIK